MKNVLVLTLAMLMVGTVLAGPSSDDRERLANHGPKAKPLTRLKGMVEKFQGKLGLDMNCEIDCIDGVAICATHKPGDPACTLDEGRCVSKGAFWCSVIEFRGELVCTTAGHSDQNCLLLRKPCERDPRDGMSCLAHPGTEYRASKTAAPPKVSKKEEKKLPRK